jgi:hypothetical protein
MSDRPVPLAGPGRPVLSSEPVEGALPADTAVWLVDD